MGLKSLNSVGGISVGLNTANVILSNADVISNNLTVTATANLGNVSNVKILGGEEGQVLRTDGAGNLSWISGAAGSPGGSNTQVQFNDGGSFGATSNFTFNKTTNLLNVNGNVVVGNGTNNVSLFSSGAISSTGNLTAANINTGGVLSVTGNANVGNIGATTGVFTNISGTLTTASQTNITAVGTLSSLSVTGNANIGNIGATNGVFTGNVSANNLSVANGITSVDYIDFATAASPAPTDQQGRLVWNSSDGTLNLGMNANVTQQIGQETYYYVRANTAITNGQVVMFAGAQGDHLKGDPANTSVSGFQVRYVMGVATENISQGEMGYVTAFGLVSELNTYSFNAGDILYLAPNTQGSLTNVTPVSPNPEIVVAACVVKSNAPEATNGRIFVRPEFIPNLYDLQDVLIANATVGQALVYTSANLWENKLVNTLGTLANISVTGNANVGNIGATNGVFTNVSGNGSALTNLPAGNIVGQVANALVAGTVYTNAQPNITSVGTLSSLSVSGNANVGNLGVTGVFATTLSATGNANVGNIGATNGVFTNVSGNGSALTSITGANVTGTVANATFATSAGSATTATSATTAGTVTTNAQPNITSVGTLSALSVTGTITGGNLATGGTLSATGNANVGNLGTAGLITATGNIQGGNLRTTGILSVGGNANVGNLGVTGVFATTLSATGNANTGNIGATNGVFTNVSGNGASLTSLTGASVTGTVANATFATSAGSATTAGTVTTAVQSNITSVGTLTSLSVSGNANVGNLGTAGLITATGNIQGNNILVGTGAGTSGGDDNLVRPGSSSAFLNVKGGSGRAKITLGNDFVRVTTGADAITFGTNATNSTDTGSTRVTISNTGLSVTGILSATGNANTGNIGATNGVFTNVSGNGAGLTNVTAGSITGQVANALVAGTVYTAAQPNITSVGTLTSLAVTGNANIGNLNATNGYFANDAIINGNLYVNGNISYLNVETVAVEDPIIQLGTGPNGAAPSANAGKDVGTALNYYDAAAKIAFMGWDVSNAEIAFGSNVSIASEVVTFTQLANTRSGNTLTTGVFAATLSATGNANVGNLGTAGLITATGNIRGGNLVTPGVLSVTGNANVGNIGATNGVFTNVSGNGAGITYANASNLLTGTVPSGRISGAYTSITGVGTLTSLSVSGNANTGNIGATNGVFTNVSGSGAALTALNGSNISTGTVAAARIATLNQNTTGSAATVTTNAQPNITSVGVLTSLSVSGNANVGNIGATNGVFTNVSGNGAGITYANASNLLTGIVPTGRISGNYTSLTGTGTLAAGSITTTFGNINIGTSVFTGNGSGLTAVPAGNLSGTIADARLSANVALLNAAQTFTSQKTFNQSLLMGNSALFNINGNGPASQINGLYVAALDDIVGNTDNPTFTAVIAGQISSTRSIAVSVDGSGYIWGYRNHTTTASYTFQSKTKSSDVAGTVTTNAQPNITSVGTLTSLAVTGNTTSGNFIGTLNGSGANVTSINANNISSGTLAQARLANASVTLGSTALTLGATVTTVAGLSSVTSTTFVGALTGAATTAGTVTTAAQPNITSVGTLTILAVTGNSSANRFLAGNGTAALPSFTFTSDPDTGMFSSAANVIGFSTGGTLRANITNTGLVVTGVISSTGNANTGNIGATNGVFTNVSGNGAALTALNGSNISTGTIAAARIATLNQNTTGSAATVTTAAQPNITSVGILTSLSVSGNANANVFYAGNGTAALPSHSFSADTNTGIYSPGADQVGISTGGTLRVTVSTTDIVSTLPYDGPNGTAALPTYGFSADTNSGVYSIGADQVGITTGGTLRANISNTGLVVTGVISSTGNANTGNIGATNGVFTNVSGNGAGITYANASNLLTGTVPSGRISGAYTSITGVGTLTSLSVSGNANANVFYAGNGTAALPSYSFSADTNTGIYSPGADQVGISTGGTLRLTVTTAQFTGTLPWRGQAGNATAPAVSFSADTNTGIWSSGADTLNFSTNGSERMRINSSGNVGIGETNPNFKLTILGPSTGAGSGQFRITPPGTAQGQRSAATFYSTFEGGADNGSRRTADIIAGFNGGAWSNEFLTFNVGNGGAANDSANVTTERMRINGSGNVGIGTAAPAHKLEVVGGTFLNGSLGIGTAPSGTTGEIRATNEITAYYSDRRLKENVKLIDNAVEKVSSLNGITYTPNDLARSFGYTSDKTVVGLFADEVDAVLPEAVRLAPFDQDEDGKSKSGENYQTIQYEKIVPLLVEAIKELNTKVKDLMAEVETLRAKG